MAATADQIEEALLAPWQSPDGGITPPVWAATTPDLIAFDNVTFTPPVDGVTPWVEVSASSGRTNTLEMDQGVIGTPTVTVSAHVGQGKGKTTARQLLDAASAMYQALGAIPAGTSHVRWRNDSEYVQTPAADGWYKLSFQVNFILY